MAEKIVSPGVFTNERDLSFLPAGISSIGAAIIGPTIKGPAFEPTVIESFSEFEQVFGPKTQDSYVPYAVEEYLKSAGTVTIVRVVGLSGYSPYLVELVMSGSSDTTLAGGNNVVAVYHPTHVDSDAYFTPKLGDGTEEITKFIMTGSTNKANQITQFIKDTEAGKHFPIGGSNFSGSFSGSYFVLNSSYNSQDSDISTTGYTGGEDQESESHFFWFSASLQAAAPVRVEYGGAIRTVATYFDHVHAVDLNVILDSGVVTSSLYQKTFRHGYTHGTDELVATSMKRPNDPLVGNGDVTSPSDRAHGTAFLSSSIGNDVLGDAMAVGRGIVLTTTTTATHKAVIFIPGGVTGGTDLTYTVLGSDDPAADSPGSRVGSFQAGTNAFNQAQSLVKMINCDQPNLDADDAASNYGFHVGADWDLGKYIHATTGSHEASASNIHLFLTSASYGGAGNSAYVSQSSGRNTIVAGTHSTKTYFASGSYMSGTFARITKDAINSVTQNSEQIFSATLGAGSGSLTIENTLTGRSADAAYSQSVSGRGTVGAPEWSADAQSLTASIQTTQQGGSDADSFVLYFSGSGGGSLGATYTNNTNFDTGHADTGNILTTATAYSASVNPNSSNHLTKVFGMSPKDRYKPVYTYMWFKNYASSSYAADSSAQVQVKSIQNDISYGYSVKDGYEARTPWITSQKVGGKTTNLFKFHTRAHGPAMSYQIKAGILNVKGAGTVAGSEYGTFSVQLRRVDLEGSVHAVQSPWKKSGDSDRRPEIVEQWNNLTLDPDNPNFIGRVIGDRYQEIDADGKVTMFGDYPNLSQFIWVELPEDVKDKGTSAELVPFGFAALLEPLNGTHGSLPSASFIGNGEGHLGTYNDMVGKNLAKKGSQVLDNVYNKKVFYGFDYSDSDNLNYLMPLPDSSPAGGNAPAVGNNKAFNLANCFQHPSASLDSGAGTAITPTGTTINLQTKKFMVPFQGGFDGLNPARYIARGSDISATNMLGYDLSTMEKDGALAYKRALNAISNPDEIDINMILTPGPNMKDHAPVTTYAKNVAEDRADTFYIMDSIGKQSSMEGLGMSTITNVVKSFDSNYTATYWPWVKIMDSDINKPVWVPPSVVAGGVISHNDNVAFEWFAPAGFNRGMLTTALEVESRLTHAERDDLYEGRVNPIATFKEGISVWGQKTLQARPSALDRINVRRLLIAAKKFIASATKYLVFENNTTATRNRFLNIANPYFESVQQRQGIYAFKVIMDESNNTADVIDRNQMIGEIFLQPAKSAEFIILDFNILPTGAVFPE